MKVSDRWFLEGDKARGKIAAQLGAALKDGSLKLQDLGSRIYSDLCQKPQL